MAFGSGSKKRRRSEIAAHEDVGGADADVVVHEDDSNTNDELGADGSEEEDAGSSKKSGTVNPLYDEVTVVKAPKGKNDSGTKQWQCKHCQKKLKGSLTRIRIHLLGPPPGKKAEVARCVALLKDPIKCKALRDKVQKYSFNPLLFNFLSK